MILNIWPIFISVCWQQWWDIGPEVLWREQSICGGGYKQ